jgi:hypothetical protein
MALVRTPTQGAVKETSPPARLALPGPTFAFRSSDTVTLLVGQSATKMTVHESYITCTSEFFATALKKAWVEGQTRVIKLPEEDPVHLAYYLDWIYTRKSPSDFYYGRALFGALIVLPDSYRDLYISLSHLYVLGERMLDTKFRNALLEEIVRIMNLEQHTGTPTITFGMSPPLEVISTIYQGTTSTSPARRLLVDWCLAFGHQAQYTILHDKEFLVDIAKSFSDKTEKGLASSEFRGVSLRYGEYRI